MNPTDPDTWQEYNDRPAAVRRHRSELQAATGLDIPRNLAEIEDWLSTHKSAMTRKLNALAEENSTDDGGEE